MVGRNNRTLEAEFPENFMRFSYIIVHNTRATLLAVVFENN